MTHTKKLNVKMFLATAGAAACFVLGVGLPTAHAANTVTFDTDKLVDGSGVEGVAPTNLANGEAGVDTSTNLPGQSTGDVDYCINILSRAACADSGGSPAPGVPGVPGVPPITIPSPGTPTVPPTGTPGGSNAGGSNAGDQNSGAPVNVNRGDGLLDADVTAGPVDASVRVPAASSCDDGQGGLLSAETRSPLSSDVFVGGGVAGTLLAGAMALKRFVI